MADALAPYKVLIVNGAQCPLLYVPFSQELLMRLMNSFKAKLALEDELLRDPNNSENCRKLPATCRGLPFKERPRCFWIRQVLK